MKRTWVWFPEPISSGSWLPETPAPWEYEPSLTSVDTGHMHTEKKQIELNISLQSFQVFKVSIFVYTILCYIKGFFIHVLVFRASLPIPHLFPTLPTFHPCSPPFPHTSPFPVHPIFYFPHALHLPPPILPTFSPALLPPVNPVCSPKQFGSYVYDINEYGILYLYKIQD